MGLVCLDLDGTLVESALEEVDGKLQPAPGVFNEPELIGAHVFDVLERRAREGDSFAIVTNQGGVAWGYHTEAEVWARIGRTVGLLGGFFGRPFSIHVCFVHPRATIARYREGHERRKPSGAMIEEAVRAHGTPGEAGDLVMVGDLADDEKAAEAAGAEFIPAGTFFDW